MAVDGRRRGPFEKTLKAISRGAIFPNLLLCLGKYEITVTVCSYGAPFVLKYLFPK